MIEKVIGFLEKHRYLNLLLVLIYTVSIISLHDFMVNQSIVIMNALGLDYYNTIVAYGSIVLGLIMLVFLVFQLIKNKIELSRKLFFLIATLIFMILHFHFMFEMNIEIIHSLQYGILGFLLFPFSRKIGASVVLSLPIMLLDEWYQYQVLYPDYVEYFEFNDIVMNIFGLALLCIIIWISGVRQNASSTAIYKRFDFKILMGYVGLVALLMITGIVVLYPENKVDHTFLVLNELAERSEFWVTHKFTGAKYHVLTPIESFVVIFWLSIFYMFADYKFIKQND